MTPENCPACKSPRKMLADGVAAFQCESVYRGDSMLVGCVTPMKAKLTLIGSHDGDPPTWHRTPEVQFVRAGSRAALRVTDGDEVFETPMVAQRRVK